MESKIPLLIVNKGQELVTKLVPPIIDIANKTGIQNIGTPNVQIPNTCLPSSDLQNLLTLRNTLIDKINTTSDIINKLSAPLNALTPTVDKLSSSLQKTDVAKNISKVTIPFLPTSPPGTPSPAQLALVGLSSLTDLTNFLTPKITTAKNTISSTQNSLDYVNNILKNLISTFKSIDQYLTKCGAVSESTPLTSLNSYMQQLEQQQNVVQANSGSQVYKGFVLEVKEEPFSPTVNRRKAVALNPQGIVLLQTPLSFTTTPQVLIQELKLIIDSSNLKAE